VALDQIQEIYNEFAPNRTFYFEFLEDEFNKLYKTEIRMGQLFGIFGSVTILISCIGLFGLVSYSIEMKIKEIGIRKVFGATVPGLVFAFSKEFTSAVLWANLFTWPVVYLVMDRWLQNYAYRITMGPDVFILAALVTQFVALVTVSFKSIKAASTNPVEPLKYE
jgi:putative ABC transport system permease protein